MNLQKMNQAIFTLKKLKLLTVFYLAFENLLDEKNLAEENKIK